jgi:hypothetical protein
MSAAILLLSAEYASGGKYRQNADDFAVATRECAGVITKEISINPINDLGWYREFYENLLAAIGRGVRSIVIDISTMPRQRMSMILSLCLQIRPECVVHVFYARAGAYSTDSDRGWLSRDVASVGPVPLFNGTSSVGKERLLILCAGHEYHRAEATIEWAEPTRVVILGQHREPDAPFVIDRCSEVISKLHASFQKLIWTEKGRMFHRNEAHELSSYLIGLIDSSQGQFNVELATYATKLLSVGAILAAIARPRVRFLMARPQSYNIDDYSSGVGKTATLRIQ